MLPKNAPASPVPTVDTRMQYPPGTLPLKWAERSVKLATCLLLASTFSQSPSEKFAPSRLADHTSSLPGSMAPAVWSDPTSAIRRVRMRRSLEFLPAFGVGVCLLPLGAVSAPRAGRESLCILQRRRPAHAETRLGVSARRPPGRSLCRHFSHQPGNHAPENGWASARR
jgi:hypothetical protein